MMATQHAVGDLLRSWRQRRRLSQLGLACDAGISARHLSFVETGRAAPSREMILQLAEHLQVPLRDRNALLLAAGYAPVFPHRSFQDSDFDAVRHAIELVLAGHEPYPALTIDRHWNLLAANRAVTRLLVGVDPALLQPPVNVLRLTLHRDGLAARILNLAEWRAHLFARLRRHIEITGDAALEALLDELCHLETASEGTAPSLLRESVGIGVPLQIAAGDTVLSLLSTTAVFGTAVDITLSEIALESFFPADTATAEALRELAEKDRRESASSAHDQF